MGFTRQIGLQTDVDNIDLKGFNESVRNFAEGTVNLEGDLLLVLNRHDATRGDGVVLMVHPVKVDPEITINNLWLHNSGKVKLLAEVKVGKKARERLQKIEDEKAKKEGRQPVTVKNVEERELFFDSLSAEQIGLLMEQGEVIEDGNPMSFWDLMKKFKNSPCC